MSKKFEQNNTEQTSALSFSSSNISESNNDLAKSLLNVDKSETIISSNQNSENFDNPKLITYKKNNTSIASKNNERNNNQSDINKNIDNKIYGDLLKNLKDKPNESMQSKEELEKHQENKSNSYNKNKNKDLSLTKLNSNGSGNILQSSIIILEVNEKPEARNKDNDNDSDIIKDHTDNNLSEISGRPKSKKNDLKEKEDKDQKELREKIKSTDKIKKFREKYNILDIKKYPKDVIYHYLKENNFNEEKAFEDLSKYINS